MFNYISQNVMNNHSLNNSISQSNTRVQHHRGYIHAVVLYLFIPQQHSYSIIKVMLLTSKSIAFTLQYHSFFNLKAILFAFQRSKAISERQEYII